MDKIFWIEWECRPKEEEENILYVEKRKGVVIVSVFERNKKDNSWALFWQIYVFVIWYTYSLF